MSHQSSEFELAKGVNVLTGPNNSGKSAVISAIQMLAELPVKEGDYMVRHGTTESEVTIVTDEDDELTWQRKGSTIALIINGEKHGRLQNDREHYLEKLHKYLRLPKVSGNETKQDFDIHFATQKEPIFLINEPASRAALFFASSSDAGRLVEVREKFKDLVKTKKKEQQQVKIILEQQSKILAQLVPIDDIEEQIKFVMEAHQQFPKEKEVLRQASSLHCDLRKHLCEFKRCSSRHQTLRTLFSPPSLDDSLKIEHHRNALAGEIKNFRIQSNKSNALSSITPPPTLLPSQNLAKELHVLRQAIESSQAFKKIVTLLDKVQNRPELEATESLDIFLTSMRDLLLKKNILNSLQIHLDEICPTPLLDQETPLLSFLKEAHLAVKRKQDLRDRVNTLIGLSKVPPIENLPQIEKDHIDLRNETSKLSLAGHISSILSELKMPPDINQTTQLNQHLSLLKDAIKQHSIDLQRSKLREFLQKPPEIEDIGSLQNLLEKYSSQNDNVLKMASQQQKTECILQEWVIQNPTCPCCGGVLNLETVVQEKTTMCCL